MRSTGLQSSSVSSPTIVWAAMLITLGACASTQAAPSTLLKVLRGNSGPQVTVTTYPSSLEDNGSTTGSRAYDITATAHTPGKFDVWAQMTYSGSGCPDDTRAKAVAVTTIHDLIITRVDDPEATGDVLVALRFNYVASESFSGNVTNGVARAWFDIAWDDGIFPRNPILLASGAGTITTPFGTLPLKEPITLKFLASAEIDMNGFPVCQPHWGRDSLSFELAATPFVFAEFPTNPFGENGYTASSESLLPAAIPTVSDLGMVVPAAADSGGWRDHYSSPFGRPVQIMDKVGLGITTRVAKSAPTVGLARQAPAAVRQGSSGFVRVERGNPDPAQSKLAPRRTWREARQGRITAQEAVLVEIERLVWIQVRLEV